jgi:tetratricopeptide (TPR) repeat protein
MTIKLFACACVLSLATLVRAQPVDKTQTAKEYVSAGLAAQKAGDYDTALTFYGKAYELVPHPVLLFNMAQANRLAGRNDKAIELYKKYLEAEPKGAQSQVAKGFVAEHDAQVAAEEAKRKDEAAKRDEAIRNEQTRKADEARKQDEAYKEQTRKVEAARKQDEARKNEAATQPPPAAPATTDDGGRPLRIAGITAAGVGVVGIGAGVLFGLHARSLSNDLSAPGALYDPQKVSDGQAANRNMIISTIVGGALVAGGVVLYIVGSNKQSEHVALLPIVLDHGGGIAFGGAL